MPKKSPAQELIDEAKENLEKALAALIASRSADGFDQLTNPQAFRVDNTINTLLHWRNSQELP